MKAKKTIALVYGNTPVGSIDSNTATSLMEAIGNILEEDPDFAEYALTSIYNDLERSVDGRISKIDLFQSFSSAKGVCEIANLLTSISLDQSVHEFAVKYEAVALSVIRNWELGLKVHIPHATDKEMMAVLKRIQELMPVSLQTTVKLLANRPYWKYPEDMQCIYGVYSDQHIDFPGILEVFKNVTLDEYTNEAIWSKTATPDEVFLDKCVSWASIYETCESEHSKNS